MRDLAIDVKGLRKSYGEIEAVRGVDLQVERGECFAMLGPNGAGKTTTVEVLEGHRKRSDGEVSVLGSDPARPTRAFRERVGIVLQEVGVERYLTVEEVIDLFGSYYPNPLPTGEVLELVGLQDKRRSRVGKLSGGQRRRLDVAVGIAGNPELLFLDEPTTGFDPSARRGAWEMIENLHSLGKTIFLTTHYMDEAQYLADRLAIITGGRIVAEGTLAELSESVGSQTHVSFRLTAGPADDLPAVIRDHERRDGRFEVQTSDPTRLLHELTSWAVQRGIELVDLKVGQATLEDVYLHLTAPAARDVAA